MRSLGEFWKIDPGFGHSYQVAQAHCFRLNNTPAESSDAVVAASLVIKMWDRGRSSDSAIKPESTSDAHLRLVRGACETPAGTVAETCLVSIVEFAAN